MTGKQLQCGGLAAAVFSTSLALGWTVAAADERPHQAVVDTAEVIDVVPLYRQVTVEIPVRECVENTRYEPGRYEHERHGDSVPAMIVGGVIGGLIGNQFGDGRGNDAMTVVGTLIGASVGNNAARQDRAWRRSAAYPAETCTTRYESRIEQQDDGYRVTYEYGGRRYSTHMYSMPGDRIPVRVSVRPAL